MSSFHSAVTTITHHIPWFIREPAVAIIGERCYSILIYDFDITHTECFKYSLSKVLGLGIVIGGSIIKIPQMLKIISTRSVRGLSLPAYILETASYAISLAYAARAGFPFSTYGENFFIAVQNVIITLLILYLTSPKGAQTFGTLGGPNSPAPPSLLSGRRRVVVGGTTIVVATLFLWSKSLCSSATLSLLQLATIPLSLLSKAPQIMENYTSRSTGNLSAFAVFSALLGCLARLFTTKQEVNDPLIFWGFLGAALLNVVLALQMVVYWKSAPEDALGLRMRNVGGSNVIESPTNVMVDDTGRRSSRKLD